MKQRLSRSQKLALLSQLVAGDAQPVRRYKAAQDAPFAYILNCFQTFPADQSGLPTAQPTDLITGIVLTSSFTVDKPSTVKHLPDMIRAEFDQWCADLGTQGIPIVGMMGTRLVPAQQV